MNEKDFEELMVAAGNRPTKVERIVRELLEGEFSDIQQSKVRLRVGKLREKHRAIAMVKSDSVRIELFLDSDYLHGIGFPERNEDTVRELIRHELEHVRSGLGDDDSAFWVECLKKGIPVSV